MKKLLAILVLGLLLSSNAYAARATCFGGQCEFIFSLHYEWAETSCYQSMVNEEVDTSFLYFTIVETGEECRVWDSR